MALEKKIKTILLGNGETLKIYDASRKVAGDAWLVRIIFRIRIAVTVERMKAVDGTDIRFEELVAALGESVLFEVVRERNFILEAKKNQLIEDFIDDYLTNTCSYISKPSFPVRFILKQYTESLKKNLPNA
ncbi:MAG: hypothetical protein ACOZF0_16855 [Thermodesulfobacteriota bacterium]